MPVPAPVGRDLPMCTRRESLSALTVTTAQGWTFTGVGAELASPGEWCAALWSRP